MIEEALNSEDIEWKQIELQRGDLLIREGQVEKYVYFVKSGALRAYIITDSGDFTLRFGYSGSIITSLPSFFNGKPSELSIEAIRKCNLLQAKKSDFERFIQSSEKRLLAYQKVIQDLISDLLEREIDLMYQSPQERFNRVHSRSPQLFQEVPHKYIASYLRMSPETLSRILKS
tara:strand:- start:31 stop:552 length:522 start_codon:yes stop_codon:yes gene_type:complete